MGETPSNRRHKGREAFMAYENPMDHQPYKKGSWAYEYYLKDWLDGWEEAAKEYFMNLEKEEVETCAFCDNYRGCNYCANCGRALEGR